MGVFTPDLTAVDAGFPIYEKGMYRVQVKARTPETWEKEEDDGTKVQVARIRYKLEMFARYDGDDLVTTDESGKEIRGKPVQAMDLYLHSEGALSVWKLFMMAALGFAKNEESEFNEFFSEHSDEFVFSGDPGDSDETLESNTGGGWSWPVDRFVDVFLQKTVETYDGVERDKQAMGAWQPAGERYEV